jgi:hypothetical protein
MSSEGTRTLRGLIAGMLACLVAIGVACADFSRGAPSPATGDGGPSPGDGGGEGGATLSFAADVYPLFVPACEDCHAAGEEAGDTQLLFTGSADADYASVAMFVDTSAPAGSRLLSKMTGNGHQGGAVYAAGSPEYQTVLHWIEQGAPQ